VEIIRAGYATSDIYVKECSKIIEKYRLYEYDQIAMNGQNNQITEDEQNRFNRTSGSAD
jgi:flagellum-specific peptidoglycan hydrolase FlgJ